MLALPMLSGCLVDDPPTYTAPTQTPPRLDYPKAFPPLDQIIIASQDQTLTFTIPVTSEDAGEKLQAQLWLDFKVGSGDGLLNFALFPPSTLQDTTPRALQLSWDVDKARGTPGCHRFTMRVAHESSWPSDIKAPVTNTSDLAEAYWWANIAGTPGTNNTLVDCPLASRAQQ